MARAYRFTIIRIPAPSLEEAHEIIGRLTAIGFPRQSMNVTPHEDDSYHVAVHTHEANRERVRRVAEGDTGQGVPSAVMTGAILAGGALLGAGLWAMWRSANPTREFVSEDQPRLRSSGRTTLMENAEKALRMKQEAGPLANIPEHRTANEGAIHGGQIGYTDTALGKEGTFTENTGRSHGARVGDS
jgi:hypothetical protein